MPRLLPTRVPSRYHLTLLGGCEVRSEVGAGVTLLGDREHRPLTDRDDGLAAEEEAGERALVRRDPIANEDVLEAQRDWLGPGRPGRRNGAFEGGHDPRRPLLGDGVGDGRADGEQGDDATGERHLAASLETFTRVGAAFEIGRTHLLVAEIVEKRGDRARAQRHLAEATTWLTSVDAPVYHARLRAATQP